MLKKRVALLLFLLILVPFLLRGVEQADATTYTYSKYWSITASNHDCTADTTSLYMQPLTNPWLGFPRASSGVSDRETGLLYFNVEIPQGATILSANITGVAYASYSNIVNLTIKGQKSNNPSAFSTYADYASRPRTTANVDWDVSDDWSYGSGHTSPDISTVLQEIVNQVGRVSGNAIVLFITNDGTTGSTRRAFNSYDYSSSETVILGATWTVTEASVTTKSGMSGYLTTTAWIDTAITQMTDYQCGIFRLSFNPSWWTPCPKPYDDALVQYYLDNTPDDWIIIVDVNHLYPYGSAQDADFISHIATAKSDLLEVCSDFPNNTRVYVEIVNEFTGAKSYVQECLDEIRDEGYTNYVVWNRMYAGNWVDLQLTDPLNKWCQGMHFYFNDYAPLGWTVDGAITQMVYAKAYGLPVICTEVGADWNEGGAFKDSTVQRVNEFIAWCESYGVSICIWQSTNLQNTVEYNNHGMLWFNYEPPPPPSDIVLYGEYGTDKIATSPILAGYLANFHPSETAYTSAHGTNIYAYRTFSLTNVTLRLAYTGSQPTCNLWLNVYQAMNESYGAFPNPVVIASSEAVNASTLGLSWTYVNFTFATPFELGGGNFYTFALATGAPEGTIDDTHRVYIQFYNASDAKYRISQYISGGWIDDEPANGCRIIMKVYGLLGEAKTYYTVVVQNGTYGYSFPSGTYIEEMGYDLGLTASPMNVSYAFNYWQVAGSNRIGLNPYTLTFSQNMTLYPVFGLANVGGSITGLFTSLWFPIALVTLFGVAIILMKGGFNR